MSAERPSPVTFTVFTPTHQRAHTLERVYRSLRAQTLRDFEWIIVDDGSTDATGELVAGWVAEADFPIRYLWQQNAGKHVAMNRGVREARGDLFLGFDSDDECDPTALERLKALWDGIPEADRVGFSAVSVLCRDQHGDLIGSRFPWNPTDSDPLEIRLRYGVTGDKWGFHTTEVLRAHPFPEMTGQAYVTESVVWNRIALKYRTRYVNECLYTYYLEKGENSLTKRPVDAGRRAPMFVLSNAQRLNDEMDWFRFAPVTFVKAAANYVRYSLHSARGARGGLTGLRPLGARALVLTTAPLGVALYLRDKVRASRATR